MYVSFIDTHLRERVAVLRGATSGAKQRDAAMRELLDLVGKAPTLGSLLTLRSVRLVRLREQPMSYFTLTNEEAELVVYPIDGSGLPIATGPTGTNIESVRYVCITELTETQLRGVGA